MRTLLVLTSFPALCGAKAILGVDLGSLYMKVALVQRGAPLEIVTNLHAKRKTENMILFDQSTRFYGADANSLYGRKPDKSPMAVSVLLGRHDEHPSVNILAERHYPILPKYNESRSGLTLMVDGQDFTPEELVAMLLTHARDITIAYGVEKGNPNLVPKDLVLTVPSFYTQHERKALLDAAALAEFNVLALIDETTAAALHFGMDKVMEDPKIFIFYNLGASSLQVSVVRFLSYQYKDSKFAKARTVGGLEVLGKAWDATLGGDALDHRIIEHMADQFNAKWGKGDVRKFPRAMAKLRIQANKVKHVLSANSEIPIFIEALHDDLPLNTKMDRATLEDLCGDLLQRAVIPITDALKRANVTLEQVDGIELIGGGMRVPKIQEYLQKYLGTSMELGLHINSDESMALGAAFHGANISTAFKVRHVGMADLNPFSIKISLSEMQPSNDEAAATEVWSKEATIFKSGGKVGVKKTIAFSYDRDVHCMVDYEETETLPKGTQLSLERYNVSGLSDFAAEMKAKELGIPKVSLQFELSNSGITRLVKAEAAVEEMVTVQEEVEVDDDSQEESKNDDTSKEEKIDTKAENDEVRKDEKQDSISDDEKAKDDKKTKGDKKTDKASKKKKKIMVEKIFGFRPRNPAFIIKEKKKVHKRALKINSYHIGRVQPYSSEIMAESKAKMEALAQKDRERQLLEAAKNKVESYIYKIKNKLIDDEENINKVSTEEQREEISKLATDAEEWLYDDGYNADLVTMEDKYAELYVPAQKIFFRVSELTARPAAVLALKEKLNKIVSLMTKWETTHPQVTEDERKDVLSKVEEIRTWLSEKEAEQDKLSKTEEPVLISEELPFKTKAVESIVSRLSRKPKPKPPKKEKKEDGNETKAENETVTDEPILNESQPSGSDSEGANTVEEEVPEGDKETVGVGEEL